MRSLITESRRPSTCKPSGLRQGRADICNVALAAAFLAARDGGPLTMAHLAAAATREYHKLEKPLSGRELARGR